MVCLASCWARFRVVRASFGAAVARHLFLAGMAWQTGAGSLERQLFLARRMRSRWSFVRSGVVLALWIELWRTEGSKREALPAERRDAYVNRKQTSKQRQRQHTLGRVCAQKTGATPAPTNPRPATTDPSHTRIHNKDI